MNSKVNATYRFGVATSLVATLMVLTMSACSKPAEDTDGAATEGEAAPVEETAKIVTTESGLMYEILESGDGATPKEADRVTVHYRGTLEDGPEFDSSHKRGQPAVFPVNRVI